MDNIDVEEPEAEYDDNEGDNEELEDNRRESGQLVFSSGQVRRGSFCWLECHNLKVLFYIFMWEYLNLKHVDEYLLKIRVIIYVCEVKSYQCSLASYNMARFTKVRKVLNWRHSL